MTDERDDKDWFFLQSVLTNLIGWGFFILFEFLEGRIHSNRGNGLLYGIFGIPILICILFCAMEWRKKGVHVNMTDENEFRKQSHRKEHNTESDNMVQN